MQTVIPVLSVSGNIRGALVCSGCYNKNILDSVTNEKQFFLIVLEVGNTKIKAPADLVLGEDCLPGLPTATSLLCPQGRKQRKGRQAPSGLFR